MKFFRIVLGTTPEGGGEGDERDTEGLSCGSAPSEATAGATRSSRTGMVLLHCPRVRRRQRSQASVPYWFGMLGGPRKGHALGQGGSPHAEQFLGEAASANKQQPLPQPWEIRGLLFWKSNLGTVPPYTPQSKTAQNVGGDIFLLINCPSFMIQYFPLFLGCTLFDYFFVCQHF